MPGRYPHKVHVPLSQYLAPAIQKDVGTPFTKVPTNSGFCFKMTEITSQLNSRHGETETLPLNSLPDASEFIWLLNNWQALTRGEPPPVGPQNPGEFYTAAVAFSLRRTHTTQSTTTSLSPYHRSGTRLFLYVIQLQTAYLIGGYVREEDSVFETLFFGLPFTFYTAFRPRLLSFLALTSEVFISFFTVIFFAEQDFG